MKILPNCLNLLFAKSLFLVFLLIPFFTVNAWANTYTVTNTSDALVAVAGSLRQAVANANGNLGPDVINFAIPLSDPGCNLAGVCKIQLNSELLVTNQVTIDGYTQNACPSTAPLCAQVATASAPAILTIEIVTGLNSNGIHISGQNSSGSTIRGLNIHGSTYSSSSLFALIRITNSNDNNITGNFLGTDVTGQTAMNIGTQTDGVLIEGGDLGSCTNNSDPSTCTEAVGNIVGGSTADKRNILSGNGTAGIAVAHNAHHTSIIGNYVGTNAQGTTGTSGTRQGAGVLITVRSAESQIGTHHNVVSDNLIANNLGNGITMNLSKDNTIVRNNIGVSATGGILGNGGNGISLMSSNNNMIGGDMPSDRNIIANNGARGILVAGTGAFGTSFPLTRAIGNKILSNSIFSNALLGIDLARAFGAPTGTLDLGPTLNDIFDLDGGQREGNDYQNVPIINGQNSFINSSLVQVWGSLDSKPNQDYLIQVFANLLADSSGYGEGQVYVGSLTVHTDDNGHVDFHFPAKVNAPSVNGVKANILTATATDLLTGDTSEFSKAVNVDAKGNPTAYENANGDAGSNQGDSTEVLMLN